jgi:hypothetical protein
MQAGSAKRGGEMKVKIALAIGIASFAVTPSQAQSNPPGVNPTHFLCYRVSATSKLKPVAVKLKDQFGAFGSKLGQPLFMCTPVSKNGEEVKDTRTHLTCYSVSAKNAGKTVVVVHQFGKQQMRVGGSVVLCLPSLKEVRG